MRFLTVFMTLLLLNACSTNAPPSAAGLYGPRPEAQKISGSKAQGKAFRMDDYTREEVFEASNSALLRLGYSTDVSNEVSGIVAGSGYYSCSDSARFPLTLAIYIEQIDTSPLTRYTAFVDRHDIPCSGAGENLAASQIIGEIQKVLSTE